LGGQIFIFISIDPFIQCVVLGNFLHCLNWKNMISTDTKDFCEKKWALILGQLSNSKERKRTRLLQQAPGGNKNIKEFILS
jgi:hypothetical protein